MMNQLILVGRIKEMGVLEKDEIDNDIMTLKIAVTRSFKNAEGVYDIDIIEITLNKGIAQNTNELCEVGDLIGVKGRIANLDGNNGLSIIAEKISFLSSKKANENE